MSLKNRTSSTRADRQYVVDGAIRVMNIALIVVLVLVAVVACAAVIGPAYWLNGG